jgi:hypothetical protein
MSLSNYYKILGLPPGSSQAEIRKRYRKLVMLYHPDKNPSVEARKKFELVQEAYEVLCGKKQLPIKKSAVSSRKGAQKTKEERIREAQKRYYEQKQREQAENERFYQQLFKGKKWLIIRIAAVVGTVFSCALLIEWFLPSHFEQDRIESFSYAVTSFDDTHQLSVLKTINGRLLWVTENKTILQELGEIQLRKSWIFHDPIECISMKGLNYQRIDLKLTFFAFGSLFIVVFLLPVFTWLFPRKTSFYTLLYYVTLYISPIAIVLFLLGNDHWAHFLCFGYY